MITEIGAIAPRSGDEVIACDGGIVTAGLVNTHHHLYQWITRGYATDDTLFGWLAALYPVWSPEGDEVLVLGRAAGSAPSGGAGELYTPAGRGAWTA